MPAEKVFYLSSISIRTDGPVYFACRGSKCFCWDRDERKKVNYLSKHSKLKCKLGENIQHRMIRQKKDQYNINWKIFVCWFGIECADPKLIFMINITVCPEVGWKSSQTPRRRIAWLSLNWLELSTVCECMWRTRTDNIVVGFSSLTVSECYW